MLPDSPADGIDLMKKLLHFNPDKRITADEALRHPFVQRLGLVFNIYLSYNEILKLMTLGWVYRGQHG